MSLRNAAALLVIAALALLVQAPAVAGMPAETQRVSGKVIAALAQKTVAKLVDGVDHIAEPAFTVVDQMVRPGDVAFVVQPPQVSASYINVPIAINVDGQLAKTAYVGYRVMTTVVTAVATHDLNAGALLGAGDVTMGRVPNTYRPAVEADGLLGRKLIMAVAKGHAIFSETTAVNELVKAGQPCIIIVHDGPVALSADVIARTGGGVGDLVAVWNPRTNRALSGTVTGPGRVELTLPSGDGKS